MVGVTACSVNIDHYLGQHKIRAKRARRDSTRLGTRPDNAATEIVAGNNSYRKAVVLYYVAKSKSPKSGISIANE